MLGGGRVKSKVRLRIETGDTGFDITVVLPSEDADHLTELFSQAVQRAYGPRLRSRDEGAPNGGAREVRA